MNAFKAQKILGDEELTIVKVWISEKKGSSKYLLGFERVHCSQLSTRFYFFCVSLCPGFVKALLGHEMKLLEDVNKVLTRGSSFIHPVVGMGFSSGSKSKYNG